MVVVLPTHHDVLNLDAVSGFDVALHLIVLVHNKNVHIRGHFRIRRLHQLFLEYREEMSIWLSMYNA